MKALVFEPTPARLAVAGLASRLSSTGALGPGSPLRLRELPDPKPPRPDWVEVEPAWCGICGSDVHEACLDADMGNPLSGVIGFPHVMGHEIVARDGSGRYVVVDPWLTCEARGDPEPCPACLSGHPPLCERALEGSGMHLGNTPGLPGGFSTRMVAHRSQLHALPAGLEPKAGVLADPLAVASHAVDRACAATGSGPIVVLGAGTIGLCVLAALRHRFPEARPLVTAAWPHSRLRVEALGAVAVAPSPDGVVAAVAGLTGEEPVRPWRGGRWLRKGASVVIDTIGSSDTLGLALRIAGRRARIVKVGVGRAGRVDWTLAYVKEVDVLGSNGYGRGAIPAAVEMLAAGEVPHAGWLTHTFPLAQWRRAFETARRPGRNQAIKVVVEVCP